MKVSSNLYSMIHNFTILFINFITNRIESQLLGDLTCCSTSTEHINNCLIWLCGC